MVKNRKDITPRRSLVRNGSKLEIETRANVKVVVRVRPHNAKEVGDNYRTVIKCISNQHLTFDPKEDLTPFFYHGVEQKGRDFLKKANKNINFNFDYVFKPESNNDEVFEYSTKNLIEALMNGYNCSVFAYGATGAGKTFTMLGSTISPGITYLTMKELFKQKETLSEDRDFELAVSYLEVYNENVQDLLKPGGPPLHLREDRKLGVIVAGITLKRIANADELFNLLEKGNKCRTQHPTDANAESSRSHAVFQVYIRMTTKNTGEVRLAKLSMIDLAGSERGAATGFKGMRFTEGANINKSLLALGNCINSLASGQKHVPYRDSKLTRLLKDSLGGNCQTVMIANVSPSSMSYEDTYNTLNYATRAKKIKSRSTKNVVNGSLSIAQYIKVNEDLKKENETLRNALQQQEEIKKGADLELVKVIEDLKKENETLRNTLQQQVEVKNCAQLQSIIAATSCESTMTVEQNVNTEMRTKLSSLFNELKGFLERLHRVKSNKSVMDVTMVLKEDNNNWLNDFCVTTPERMNGNKKLTETMEKLQKQASTCSLEVNLTNKQIEEKVAEISNLIKENPELKTEAEQFELHHKSLLLQKEVEEMKNIDKIKTNELDDRGLIMGKMARLLQSWYFIMRGKDWLTEDMGILYQDLRTHVEGACSKYDDASSEMMDTTISIPKKRIKFAEPETDGLNSTFNLPLQQSVLNKLRTDPVLAKAPLKISSRIKMPKLVKENRKPIGTMGTASRFPSVQNSKATISSKTTTKRPAPV